MSEKEARNVVTGTRQTMRLIEQDGLEAVYIAEDADIFVIKNIAAAARQHGIKVICVPSKRQLGAKCGISVGAATAGLIAEKNGNAR